MKIVVLDGYTLNPGDLSWDGLEALGEVTLYDYTSAELTVERARGFDAVITNKTLITREVIDALPGMKYIGVLATGYNVVDVEYAKRKGIPVTNIPAYGTRSVAQMTFALLLELCHHVQKHSDAVHGGEWGSSRDFCFWKHPQVELEGKTMGIIGFGRIGRQVAAVAKAFGMKIMACSRSQKAGGHEDDVQWVSLEVLLAGSDVVSLHCPLTEENRGFLNKEKLAMMKKTAFLLNTSRGPLIAEKDLAEALQGGIIAGAGLDVLSVEPPREGNPLLGVKNCLITPHIAWATREARERLMKVAVENVKLWQEGSPRNVVNR